MDLGRERWGKEQNRRRREGRDENHTKDNYVAIQGEEVSRNTKGTRGKRNAREIPKFKTMLIGSSEINLCPTPLPSSP